MDTLDDVRRRLSSREDIVLRTFLGDEDQVLEYERLENYFTDVPGSVEPEELRSAVHTLQANRLLARKNSAVDTYSLTELGEAYLEDVHGDDLKDIRGSMMFYFDTRNI